MVGRYIVVRTIWVIALAAALVTACRGNLEPDSGEQSPLSESTTPPTSPGPAPTATRTPAPVAEVLQTPVPQRAAESALSAIRGRGEIRVGVLFNYPPLGFLADNGQVQGYEPALVRRMAERWGVDVTFVQVTRQTRLSMLYDGEIDLIAAAMPHRRELEQYVEFSTTTFQGGYVVLVRADSGLDMATALTSGTVGAVGGDAEQVIHQQVGDQGAVVPVEVYAAPDEAAAALLNGRAVAVVGRRESLMLPAQVNEQLALLDGFLLQEPYAFAMQRGDTPLRDLINQTLQDLIAEGEIGAIFSQNFYGQPADLFEEQPGEPVYSFDSFPADIPGTPSLVEHLREDATLRVAGLDLAAEPGLFDSQPIYDGYNRAVINEMARRWHVPVQEIAGSAGAEGMQMLTSGQADIVVGIRADRSLSGQAAMSQPYYTRGLRLIHRADVTVFNVLDLEFKPVYIVTPVDESRDVIEDNNQFPQIKVAESYEEAFEGLVERVVYAVVGDEYALALMAEADEEIAIDERRYRPLDYVIALPAHDSDLLALVNFTLQDMKADGTLDALRKQYFGPYLPEGAELDELTLEIWPGDGSFLGVGG